MNPSDQREACGLEPSDWRDSINEKIGASVSFSSLMSLLNEDLDQQERPGSLTTLLRMGALLPSPFSRVSLSLSHTLESL